MKSITRCVIKRWSDSELQLRQWKMPIFSEVIMKITDETEIQKENNQKITRTNNKQTSKQ